MGLFSREQFEQLHKRALRREFRAGIVVDVRRTPPDPIQTRWGKRYYRLTKFNPHRFAYKVAFRHDPGNETTNLVTAMLKAGLLQLDMSQRMAGRPSEVDRELQRLLDAT